MTGTDNLSKSSIEEKILEFGGSIVQNPGKRFLWMAGTSCMCFTAFLCACCCVIMGLSPGNIQLVCYRP